MLFVVLSPFSLHLTPFQLIKDQILKLFSIHAEQDDILQIAPGRH